MLIERCDGGSVYRTAWLIKSVENGRMECFCRRQDGLAAVGVGQEPLSVIHHSLSRTPQIRVSIRALPPSCAVVLRLQCR